MHVISCSDRVYYYELGNEAEYIKRDLELYNKMVRTAYSFLYAMHNGRVEKLTQGQLEKRLKKLFNTSDYFPLSAINEAQGIFASNLECHKLHKKVLKQRLASMEKKLKDNQKELTKFESAKCKYIEKAKKNGSLTKENYLDEMKITSVMRDLKNKNGLINGRLHNTKKKLEKLNMRMPSCCFGGKKLFKSQYTLPKTHEEWYSSFHQARNRHMKITGRRQAKYSNNLFLYDVENKIMEYRVSSLGSKHTVSVKFPLTFHLHEDALIHAIQLKPKSDYKSVCYELEDYGEYFIIKAIIEVDENVAMLSDTKEGVVGIDINVDHIALCNVDNRGNVVGFKTIPFDLKKKTTNQRRHILREVIKEVFNYAYKVGKPIVMEDLDFREKKSKMMYGDKRYNGMLSQFGYSQINEISKSRSYKDRIAIIPIDPAYTSYIGKEKYSKSKGATIHLCASYVIGRRGMGYKERIPENRSLYEIEDWKRRKEKLVVC